MIKRASLADAMAAALRNREVSDPAAVILTWTAVTVFYLAFACWAHPANRKSPAEFIDDTFQEYRNPTARTTPATKPRVTPSAGDLESHQWQKSSPPKK